MPSRATHDRDPEHTRPPDASAPDLFLPFRAPRGFDRCESSTTRTRRSRMFPELSYDTIDQIRGMDIAIVTSSTSDQEGRALLKELGMPFREKAIN